MMLTMHKILTDDRGAGLCLPAIRSPSLFISLSPPSTALSPLSHSLPSSLSLLSPFPSSLSLPLSLPSTASLPRSLAPSPSPLIPSRYPPLSACLPLFLPIPPSLSLSLSPPSSPSGACMPTVFALEHPPNMEERKPALSDGCGKRAW